MNASVEMNGDLEAALWITVCLLVLTVAIITFSLSLAGFAQFQREGNSGASFGRDNPIQVT